MFAPGLIHDEKTKKKEDNGTHCCEGKRERERERKSEEEESETDRPRPSRGGGGKKISVAVLNTHQENKSSAIPACRPWEKKKKHEKCARSSDHLYTHVCVCVCMCASASVEIMHIQRV